MPEKPSRVVEAPVWNSPYYVTLQNLDNPILMIDDSTLGLCEGPGTTGLVYQGFLIFGLKPHFVTYLVKCEWPAHLSNVVPSGVHSTLPILQIGRSYNKLEFYCRCMPRSCSAHSHYHRLVFSAWGGLVAAQLSRSTQRSHGIRWFLILFAFICDYLFSGVYFNHMIDSNSGAGGFFHLCQR